MGQSMAPAAGACPLQQLRGHTNMYLMYVIAVATGMRGITQAHTASWNQQHKRAGCEQAK